MKTEIKISADDLKKLNKIKKELLTDKNATFTSYSKCNEGLKSLADKYNIDVQTIYNLDFSPKR